MLGHIALALRGGLRLVQLREPDASPDQRVSLARRVQYDRGAVGRARAAPGFGTRGAAGGTRRHPFDGKGAASFNARPPVKLWMCSCHDEHDLARATALGADAAVVSPVLTSAAHPDRPPIGLGRLATAGRRRAHSALRPRRN